MVLSVPYGLEAGTDARVRGLSEALARSKIELKVVSPSKSRVTQAGTAKARRPIRGKIPLSRLLNPVIAHLTARLQWSEVSRAIKEFNPDIIQLEQEIAGILAPRIKKQTDAPIIIDFHGIWREEEVARGLLSRDSFSYNWVTSIDNSIVRNADYVTVVSEEMREYVVRCYGSDPSLTYVVPNAAIARLDSRPFKEKTNRIVYAGTVTSRENIRLLAEALVSVGWQDPDADIHVSNRGDSFYYLQSSLTKARVRATYEWIPDELFFSYLSGCDVGLIPAMSHESRQMATPAKLYEYLSAGVPVVATDIGASWNRIIERNRVGLLTENRPEAFAKAILDLTHRPDLVYEYGNRAIALVRKELNYDTSAAKLIEIYKMASGSQRDS